MGRAGKQDGKVGKVGKDGKVGKVGKEVKVGQRWEGDGARLVTMTLPQFCSFLPGFLSILTFPSFPTFPVLPVMESREAYASAG
jgi:hypothetical protein